MMYLLENDMRIFILSFVLIFFINCSGKVQTNPITKDKKYFLPKQSTELKHEVSNKIIADYDNYAKEFFRLEVGDYVRTIWQIGLDRGHFNE